MASEYRPVSALAVAGLVVGAAGVVVLFEPDAWLVPVAGAVLSLWALRRIAASSPPMSGGRFAWGGLFLSLAFATASIVETVTYPFLLQREARQFTRQWFELLREGHSLQAFLLTRELPLRRGSWEMSLAEFTADAERAKPFEEWLGLPLVQQLLKLGPKATLSDVRVVREELGGRDEYFALEAEVHAADQRSPTSLPIELRLVRRQRRDASGGRWRLGVSYWQLLHVQRAGQPATTPERLTPSG